MQRLLLLFALLLVSQVALARDYDRNDVAERELSIGYGLSPMDIDTRGPVFCSDAPAKTCEANVARTEVFVVRGVARRHLRNFYLAVEAEVGASLPNAGFPVHPWLSGGGMTGLETSGNAWDRWRGYGELGVLAIWADTRLAETLCFTGEAGIRYQVSTSERPHMLVHLGARVMYNFSYVGVMSFAGVGWTFD